MILRDRVGGGGNEKSLAALGRCVTDDRGRDVAWSSGANAGDVGDVGWYEDSEDDCVVEALEDRASSAPAMAGGGREKDVSSEERRELSLPRISVEDAGVGGRPGRGMVIVS